MKLDGKKTYISAGVALITGIFSMLGMEDIITTSDLTELITALVFVVSMVSTFVSRWHTTYRHKKELEMVGE